MPITATNKSHPARFSGQQPPPSGPKTVPEDLLYHRRSTVKQKVSLVLG